MLATPDKKPTALDAGIVTYSALGHNGRLCNQFFQIANTISYSIDQQKKDFAFPPWEYSKYMQKELPVFGGATDNFNNHKFPFHYEPIPSFPGNVNLFGHGQSEKYFKHNWNLISPYLNLFYKYKQDVFNNYHELIKNVRPQVGRVCAIHVRRGDYDTPVNREFHGCLELSYYSRAISALYQGVDLDYILFIVFSDEIEKAVALFGGSYSNWVGKITAGFDVGRMRSADIVFSNYGAGGPVGGIGADPGQTKTANGQIPIELLDLYTMSLCDDFIISNSSYAWWGAYMGNSLNKRVVCPKKWFNNAPGHDPKDVPCEKWIVV